MSITIVLKNHSSPVCVGGRGGQPCGKINVRMRLSGRHVCRYVHAVSLSLHNNPVSHVVVSDQ